METLALTGAPTSNPPARDRIFCPGIRGLTATRADLAFLMPRLDHNRALQESGHQGDWAAVLASDPFGSEAILFRKLIEIGYSGVTNWPSSILLDGAIQQSMSTIPASPQHEYDYLARAAAAGLQTMAFFNSLEQADAALNAGIDRLVMHPGVLEVASPDAGELIHQSLKRLVEKVRQESNTVTVLAYTSEWHEQLIRLSELPVDGFVIFEADK